MARIAAAARKRLKTVPLAGLIEASGVKLARQGDGPAQYRASGQCKRTILAAMREYGVDVGKLPSGVNF